MREYFSRKIQFIHRTSYQKYQKFSFLALFLKKLFSCGLWHPQAVAAVTSVLNCDDLNALDLHLVNFMF